MYFYLAALFGIKFFPTMLNLKDVDHEDCWVLSLVDRCDAGGSSWTVGSA